MPSSCSAFLPLIVRPGRQVTTRSNCAPARANSLIWSSASTWRWSSLATMVSSGEHSRKRQPITNDSGESLMSDTPNRIDAALLTRLLHSAPGHCGNLTNYCIVREDEDYAVIAARLTDPTQEVVIKLAGPRAVLTSAFERTAAIVQLVRSHSVVRTFDLLAVDVSYRIWPWRYIVTTTVPGDHWSDVCARGQAKRPRALYASLGRTIGQLHTIHFPSCGGIAPDGSVPAGTTYNPALMEP